MRLQFTLAFVVLVAPSIFGGSIPGITATTIPSPPSFSDLVVGPDGNIWFTAWRENSIGRITPGPNFTLFPLPATNSVPLSIALGVDGNLWFTEQAGRVGRITTSGVIKEFPVASGDFLSMIVAAADGTLWFLDQPQQSGPTPPNLKLRRITTDGQLASYDLGSNDRFETMIAGPDGNLWLYDFTKNAVLKVRIKDGTVAATFPMPRPAGTNQQNHFVIGPDGNLWMSHGDSSIARIKMNGTITEYSVPTAGSTPTGLNAGGDGNLWFTEYSGRVGQLIIASATDSGQATINESDPILGTSAISLVSLPGIVPSSASSPTSAQGTVHAQDDNPCTGQTKISTHTEDGTVVQVKIDGQPQAPCADLFVSNSIVVSGAIISTSSVWCHVSNKGPSTATNVVATCNAVGGFILSSARVSDNCTFMSDEGGYVIRAKSLAKGEECSLSAGIDLSTTESNFLSTVGFSDVFDPDMKNNAYVSGRDAKQKALPDMHFNPLVGPIQRGH